MSWRFGVLAVYPVIEKVNNYTALVRQFAAAPPGKLYCLHGGRDVFRLSLHAASHALLRGVPIALVDGTNRFDLYAVTSFARRLGDRRATPEDLLKRIFISRAFTCYQMEAVITERLPVFVRRSRIPMVIIFGLLDTFYDEQAPLFEVKAGLRRIMAALRQLRSENISVLLALEDTVPASPERRSLFPSVAAGMDRVFTLTGQKELPQRWCILQGGNHGPDRTDVYAGHPARNGELDEVPARIAPGRPGSTG